MRRTRWRVVVVVLVLVAAMEKLLLRRTYARSRQEVEWATDAVVVFAEPPVVAMGDVAVVVAVAVVVVELPVVAMDDVAVVVAVEQLPGFEPFVVVVMVILVVVCVRHWDVVPSAWH
jgi:hypothetical protein